MMQCKAVRIQKFDRKELVAKGTSAEAKDKIS